MGGRLKLRTIMVRVLGACGKLTRKILQRIFFRKQMVIFHRIFFLNIQLSQSNVFIYLEIPVMFVKRYRFFFSYVDLKTTFFEFNVTFNNRYYFHLICGTWPTTLRISMRLLWFTRWMCAIHPETFASRHYRSIRKSHNFVTIINIEG